MICYIGLGSNVGDRLGNLKRAVAALRGSNSIDVTRASGVYETEPVGPPQADFYNAVVEVMTTLSAPDLLAALKAIERDLGRRDGERWGPREIDLDLLTYGDDSIDTETLRVPHPEMASRAFVLVPLAEIAPGLDVVGPGFDRSGVRRTEHSLT